MITDVVLTGGASKMPMLAKMLENFFQGKEIKKPENYHELSAMGAALEAGIVMGIVKQDFLNLLQIDAVSQSLGVEVGDG
jgi:molecular chaperone DnaK (HSP70)